LLVLVVEAEETVTLPTKTVELEAVEEEIQELQEQEPLVTEVTAEMVALNLLVDLVVLVDKEQEATVRMEKLTADLTVGMVET
jgi:hypothetical protein